MPPAYAHGLRRLRRLSKDLTRKKKGSHNRRKALQRLWKHQARMVSLRHDALHKLTTAIVRRAVSIGIEDLTDRDRGRPRVPRRCRAWRLRVPAAARVQGRRGGRPADGGGQGVPGVEPCAVPAASGTRFRGSDGTTFAAGRARVAESNTTATGTRPSISIRCRWAPGRAGRSCRSSKACGRTPSAARRWPRVKQVPRSRGIPMRGRGRRGAPGVRGGVAAT